MIITCTVHVHVHVLYGVRCGGFFFDAYCTCTSHIQYDMFMDMEVHVLPKLTRSVYTRGSSTLPVTLRVRVLPSFRRNLNQLSKEPSSVAVS